MIQREHRLQVAVNKWCREAIAVPYLLNSIDRRAATGAFSHAREKARGCVAGWPDIMVLVSGLPAMCVELKAPGKKPEDHQTAVIARIRETGHRAAWCNCVMGFAKLLSDWGVPLSKTALLMADYHDQTLAKVNPPKPRSRASKPREAKPSAARIRKAHASGIWGL